MAASMDENTDLLDSDDYYAWLGIGREATPEEINNAFRKQSRVFHPDKHGLDETKKEKAQTIFTKLKKAHEVLADPDKKAIYDAMGVKGIETEGWEIVTRVRSPQEIIEEYERMVKQREDQRLNQRTNPKGSIRVGIDATDIFDRYEDEYSEYESGTFPNIEVSGMTVSQSIEAPLTRKDTATLSGTLQTRNGTGHGVIQASLRRLIDDKSWVDSEITAGSGSAFNVKYCRRMFKQGFGTMAGTLQVTPKGIVPGIQTMLEYQIDRHLTGRLSYSGGSQSMCSTMVQYARDSHYLSSTLQLGVYSSSWVTSYSYKIPQFEDTTKLKAMLKVTTYGIFGEYGWERKISQFSILGAFMSIGTPTGITMKIKLSRGNQMYLFPVHLSDHMDLSAVFYGSVIPLLSYLVVKTFIITPYLKGQKQKDIQAKKEANAQRMKEKKKEAEMAVDLMRETVERCYEVEQKKNGLIVRKALYGKLHGEDVRDEDYINVTTPTQAIVKDSKMKIPKGTQLSELPGFYDPCPGEEKEYSINYEYRGRLHHATFTENTTVFIPKQEHYLGRSTSSSSSQQPSPTQETANSTQ